MKIVSKFHDYYDSCLSHGHDESVVYLRETKTFYYQNKENPPIIQELESWFSKARSHSDSTHFSWPNRRIFDWFIFKETRYTVDYVTLVFSGRAYNAIKVLEENTRNIPTSTNTFLWTESDAIEYFSSRGQDLRSKGYRFDRHTKEDRIKQYYKCLQPNLDWMIEKKVTCVLFDKNIVVNPVLRDIQFYRVFDAYTCYQELDMWISGTLAYPQNMMVEIEDKYRIEQHGFDMKYGFRKRPGA